MTGSKHTPGPWSYEVHELSSGYSAIVYDATGYRVGTDHLTEADARLIAAAPEMYEAIDPDTLEAVADEIDCFEHSARAASLRGIAKRQRAALSKAEGRSNG